MAPLVALYYTPVIHVPISVRLDRETERVLDRVARESGQTRSEVIRQAVRALAARKSPKRADRGPYNDIADLIGIAHGGPPDLSVNTGAKVRAMLAARRKPNK